MKYRFILLVILFSSFSQVSFAKSAYLAGTLAELFPGAGYLYQEDYKSSLLSSTLIVPIALRYYWTTPTFITKSFKENVYTTARNVFGYTVYDSFQSALTEDERNKQIVNIPHYQFSELYLAPFQGASYASWKVWVPLGIVGVISGIRFASDGISPDVTPARALIALPFIFAQSFMIGMGEETEFRGFQYPAAAQLTRSTLAGNILQSLSFGICHTRWGVCSSPYGTGQILRATKTIDPATEYKAPASPSDGQNISDLSYLLQTTAMGLWFGWITSSEEGGLLKAITAHGFFDAILVVTDMLTTNNTGRFYMSVGFPIP